MSSPIELLFEQVESETGHNIVMIRISGQLDESNVDDQSKRVYTFIEETPHDTHYIFEMSKLDYMNSKSIGYLTDWYRRITKKSGMVKLSSARENILDILDTVGLTSIIEHHPDIETAKMSIIGLEDHESEEETRE